MIEDEDDPSIELLSGMRELIRKIDTWWILNIEVPSNEDFDGKEVRPEDVQSGHMLLLDLLISVSVYGYSETEEQVRVRFEEIKKRIRPGDG